MNIFSFILTEYHFNKGQKYFNLNKPVLALKEYDKALLIRPKYDGIYLRKALSHSRLGDYKNAISAVDKAIGLNQQNSVYHLFAGVIYLESGDSLKALECFEASIQLDDKYIFAKQYKALALLKISKISEAIMIIKQTGISDNVTYKCLFCLILDEIRDRIEKNELEEIQQLINNLFTKKKSLIGLTIDRIKFYLSDPDKKHLDELFQKAQQLSQLGAHEKSIEICNTGLSTNPDYICFKKLIAENYYHMGEYSNCEQFYKGIMEQVDDDIDSLLYLGISQYKQSKINEAKETLIKAFDLSNIHSRHEIAKWLGEVYLSLKQNWNAVYYLSIAYEDIENKFFKTKCMDLIDKSNINTQE